MTKEEMVLKESSPLAVLEETQTAFDPTTQHLDLSKAEKRRTTALMMAIQAYENLIIKDADMYEAISRDRTRNDGPKIKPATIAAMVAAAIRFDLFISGKLDGINPNEVAAILVTDDEESRSQPADSAE
jgi:hypothetical protein